MEKEGKLTSEWQTIDHALAYLARADKLTHRTEGEKVLLDQIPMDIKRVLHLGKGNGRLLASVKVFGKFLFLDYFFFREPIDLMAEFSGFKI